MLFLVYLKEIRYRVFYCIFSLLYSWFICFIFIEEVVFIFTSPLLKLNTFSTEFFTHFIFTNMGDAFFSFFNLSLVIGALISLYFFLFQFFSYIVSGLYSYEKKILILTVNLSFIFLILSLNFWYFVFLPTVSYFFLGFEFINTNLPFEVLFEGKVDEYLRFILGSLSSMIILFQFPILLLFLVVFNLLKIKTLTDYRKIIYFGFLIISALFTPPDVFSQLLFILPFLLLYEYIIFITFLLNEYK